MAGSASSGLPKDKRGGGKGKKGKKPPPRMLYYGVEEKPDRRSAVPIQSLSRRLRTADGAGDNCDVTWSRKPEHQPIINYDSIGLIDIGVQKIPAPLTCASRPVAHVSLP